MKLEKAIARDRKIIRRTKIKMENKDVEHLPESKKYEELKKIQKEHEAIAELLNVYDEQSNE